MISVRPIVDYDLALDQGEGKRKATALALLALDPHPPAMALDDLLADRKPQAQVVTVARRPVVGPVEPLKDLALLFGRDANAGIGHAHPDLILVHIRAEYNLAARRSRFDRILDQVRKYLADAFAIKAALRQLAGH